MCFLLADHLFNIVLDVNRRRGRVNLFLRKYLRVAELPSNVLVLAVGRFLIEL